MDGILGKIIEALNLIEKFEEEENYGFDFGEFIAMKNNILEFIDYKDCIGHINIQIEFGRFNEVRDLLFKMIEFISKALGDCEAFKSELLSKKKYYEADKIEKILVILDEAEKIVVPIWERLLLEFHC